MAAKHSEPFIFFNHVRVNTHAYDTSCNGAAWWFDQLLPRLMKNELLDFIKTFPKAQRRLQIGRCKRLLIYLTLPPKLTGTRSDMTLSERFICVEAWRRGMMRESALLEEASADELMQMVEYIVRRTDENFPALLRAPGSVSRPCDYDFYWAPEARVASTPRRGPAVFFSPIPRHAPVRRNRSYDRKWCMRMS